MQYLILFYRGIYYIITFPFLIIKWIFIFLCYLIETFIIGPISFIKLSNHPYYKTHKWNYKNIFVIKHNTLNDEVICNKCSAKIIYKKGHIESFPALTCEKMLSKNIKDVLE